MITAWGGTVDHPSGKRVISDVGVTCDRNGCYRSVRVPKGQDWKDLFNYRGWQVTWSWLRKRDRHWCPDHRRTEWWR